ncbi:hypothetical protein NM208_g5094 [Fusarium decemcellulare]|uniref:Uncharacterized protein n=1 Tax=Fusarium decemcellulare TaxID=57161 RepID=A0ACC1SIA3_9HYPO|nr:hypothetical protein NM208_g5094 [Fusarium decemcellulare]
MERSSKLADLKLVSKYYPVTNYSYPQQPERLSQYGKGLFPNDRASLGSEGSAPGLIDDRTDSEASLDDDYQYHAHAAELWDSFWLPTKTKDLELRPRKQYPALIPSPQHRRRQAEERRIPAWPLPDTPRPRNRKPAATYSPFPKPLALPPRTTSLVPSWQCSRAMREKPQRPPRPDDDVYATRSLQNSPLVAHFATSADPYTTNFSRPVTPRQHRLTMSLEIRPATPTEADSTSSEATASQSAPHLSLPQPRPAILTQKSVPSLGPFPPESKSEAETEPHSVFEYDDSDSEAESHGGRSFWFHRRSASDQRKTGHRTAPSSPRKRQGGDVIGRMLRRSRG